jgi:hypothetical protein
MEMEAKTKGLKLVIRIEDCGNDQFIIYFSDGAWTVVTAPELTEALKDRPRIQ